jgi:hypothetical protein
VTARVREADALREGVVDVADESNGKIRPDWKLAADGSIATAGVFALGTSVAFGITMLTGGLRQGPPQGAGDVAVAFVVWLLTVVGFVGGPLLAWWASERRFSANAVIGGIVGVPVGGTAVSVLAFVGAGLGWVSKSLTGNEFVGGIVLLVVLGVAFAAMVVWLIGDGIRDLTPGHRLQVRRDIVRLVSIAVVVAFVGGIAILMRVRADVDPEAGIWVLIAGLSGGAVLLGADLGTKLLARRPGAAGAAGA